MPKKGSKASKNVLYWARMKAAERNSTLSNREMVADLARIPRKRMVQLETERTVPRIEEILALADIYGVPSLRHQYCNNGCPFRVA